MVVVTIWATVTTGGWSWWHVLAIAVIVLLGAVVHLYVVVGFTLDDNDQPISGRDADQFCAVEAGQSPTTQLIQLTDAAHSARSTGRARRLRAGRGRHLAGAGSGPTEPAAPTRGAVTDGEGGGVGCPSTSFAAGVSPLFRGWWAPHRGL
jgi:hypothetical protein